MSDKYSILNKVSCMDIFDLCDCLEDNSIDMILCDLPYGITACEWDTVIPFEPMWECFKRVIKPRGAVVLTATEPFATKLRMSNVGAWKYDWVWVNRSSVTMFIHAKNRPMNIYELVLIFSKGVINHQSLTKKRMVYNPQMRKGEPYTRDRSPKHFGGIVGKRPSHKNMRQINNGTRYPVNVIEIDSGNHKSKHPTQKPLELFEYLICTYTQPCDVVFDPCVGSGTTAIAARNTGRNFICGDSSEEYVKVARKRLAKPYTLPMFEEAMIEDKPVQAVMFE